MLKIKVNEDVCVGLKRNLDVLERVVIAMEMRKHLYFGKNQKVSIKLYNKIFTYFFIKMFMKSNYQQ